MTRPNGHDEEQLRRISEMEDILDRSAAALHQLDAALDGLSSVRGDLLRLFAYYTEGAWLADHDDDAAGKLPAGLKRGVLSQDAVFDLMSDYQRLLETMRDISREETAEA